MEVPSKELSEAIEYVRWVRAARPPGMERIITTAATCEKDPKLFEPRGEGWQLVHMSNRPTGIAYLWERTMRPRVARLKRVKGTQYEPGHGTRANQGGVSIEWLSRGELELLVNEFALALLGINGDKGEAARLAALAKCVFEWA